MQMKKESIIDENNEDNVEMRKSQFKKTLNIKNIGRKIGCVIFALIILGYFVQLYMYHNYYQQQVQTLTSSAPIFLDRYRFLSLMFTLIRERMVFNNSLSSFESIPIWGNNLDQYYYQMSMDNELALIKLRLDHPPVLQDLIDMVDAMDAPTFCSKVIASTTDAGVLLANSTVVDNTFTAADFKTYQDLVTGVMQACKYAFLSNLQ